MLYPPLPLSPCAQLGLFIWVLGATLCWGMRQEPSEAGTLGAPIVCSELCPGY